MRENVEEIRREEDEDRDVTAIIRKGVVVRDLFEVLEGENWKLIVLLDFYEFSKIYMEIPRECLDRQKLREFIEEFKARKP